MRQVIKNSIPIEQHPNVVKLWDLFTNTFTLISKEKYARLSSEKKPIAIGNAPNGFLRRFYIVEDFKGQSIEMYHAKSMSKIEVMTLPLLQEIQRRNPVENIPVYEDGRKVKDSSSIYERYLITRDEIDKAPDQPMDTAALIQAEVQRQLKAMGATPVKPESKAKDEVINDEIEDEGKANDPEPDSKPKKGRRKKSEE